MWEFPTEHKDAQICLPTIPSAKNGLARIVYAPIWIILTDYLFYLFTDIDIH